MVQTALTRQLRASSALTSILFAALVMAPSALANPLGGKVTAGHATISTPAPSTLTINQGTNRAIIEWKSFNIKNGETTHFNQPSSNSWTLNRVVGSQDPSRILGTLSANGNIVIVNPDGILFGAGARVDVNRLIATTNGISNNNFMSGNLIFNRPGNPSASIVNEGTISVKDYGLAAFVAPAVRNSGVITARLGQISLASGNKFTIDPYGDGLVKLSIDDEIKSQIFDVATGKPISDLVKNEGTLKANGGTVAMTAATARRAVNSVVNNTGVIEANSVGIQGGKIILGASTASTKSKGAPKQIVRVSGRLQAKTYPVPARIVLPKPNPRGHITITGESILATNATIDASGVYGGGTILIGGDYMGGNGNPGIIAGYGIELEPSPIPTASGVTLSSTVSVNADAVGNGDGGKIIVWSDGVTRTKATLTARGGADGGNGGFIETSGKESVEISGTVLAGAANGVNGLWLTDPASVVVGVNYARTITRALNRGTNHTISTGAKGSTGQATVAIIADIIKTAGRNATLNIFSHDGIWLGSRIASTFNKLNVNMNADYDGHGAGGLDVTQAGSHKYLIDTNGGDFTFSGQALYTHGKGIRTNGGNIKIHHERFPERSFNNLFVIGSWTTPAGVYNLNAGNGSVTINSQQAGGKDRVVLYNNAIYAKGGVTGKVSNGTIGWGGGTNHFQDGKPEVFYGGRFNLSPVGTKGIETKFIGRVPVKSSVLNPSLQVKSSAPGIHTSLLSNNLAGLNIQIPPLRPGLQRLVDEVLKAYDGSRKDFEVISNNVAYAQLADAAYSDDPKVPGWYKIASKNPKLNFTGFTAFAFKNSDGEIVVSFRGTDDLLDARTDIQLATKPIVEIKQMQQALSFTKAVREEFGRGAKITITGHSLGGGMAQYVASELNLKAVAFNPAPIAPALVRAKKFRSLRYRNITTFRGKSDPLTAATGIADIGPPAITVENSPSIAKKHSLVDPVGVAKYNHSMGNLLTAIRAVRLVNKSL